MPFKAENSAAPGRRSALRTRSRSDLRRRRTSKVRPHRHLIRWPTLRPSRWYGSPQVQWIVNCDMRLS
jgi:hypothetical protein